MKKMKRMKMKLGQIGQLKCHRVSRLSQTLHLQNMHIHQVRAHLDHQQPQTINISQSMPEMTKKTCSAWTKMRMRTKIATSYEKDKKRRYD